MQALQPKQVIRVLGANPHCLFVGRLNRLIFRIFLFSFS
jgi:hypothetical protein